MLDFIPTRARVFWNSELAYLHDNLKTNMAAIVNNAY